LLEPQIFPRFAQGLAEPLTAERLFGWHAASFPTGRGGMRKITVANWRTEESRCRSSPAGSAASLCITRRRGVEARSKDACIPRVV
jgi:hypothetical protein